ncbi:MAG: ABC transporter permease subunit [Cyclobacteriaceae bacterium]|nr:ABC transporter permease subunit [Cyclobacteriaceae bacterium]
MKKRVLIALFLIACLGPLLTGLVYSVLYSLGAIGWLSQGITLTHWQHVFTAPSTYVSFAFSLYVALGSVTVSFILSFGCVYLLSRPSQRAKPLAFAWFIPLGIPPIVAAFISFLLLSGTGVLARIVWQAGVISEAHPFPSLVFDHLGIGIIITHIMISFPFFTLLQLQHYEKNQLAELMGLARHYGANRRQQIRDVMLPVLFRRSFPVLLLSVIFVMGSYEIPLTIGSQYPQMISPLIIDYVRRFDLQDKPIGYALSVVYTLVVLVLAFFLLRKQTLRYGK